MRLGCILTFLNILLLSVPIFAQQQYLLTTTSPTTAVDICGRHGLTFNATAWSSSDYGKGVYLVTAPAGSNSSSVTADVTTDAAVAGFEAVQPVFIPELAQSTEAILQQSTEAILQKLATRTGIPFFGSTVPNYYVHQSATTIIHSNAARKASSLTGTGITIAVIDTGIDPNHTALAGVLVPGFDFTRGLAGTASELADLDPQVAAALAQSTEAILQGQNVFVLNGSTAAILDQSTEAILQNNIPKAFGHGTMTAGLVHLVAPNAKIMPLKAFSADGTSDTFNIVRAIYFAAESGVNVISMSFEMAQASPGLQASIQYAQSKGVVLVAAAGNDNWQTPVFPASLQNVLGAGSTDAFDVKSTFSNFGSADVKFAAPGESVITTFPGGFYAAGWGTSFSAPLLTGGVALVLHHNFAAGRCGFSDLIKPLSKTQQVSQMGYGRIDLLKALTSFSGVTSKTTTGCSSINYAGPAISANDGEDGNDD